MGVDSQLLQLPNTLGNANDVKDLILLRLFNDGILNQEQYELYNNKYHIIIVKRSWFKRWREIFGGDDSNSYYYHFVRLIR